MEKKNYIVGVDIGSSNVVVIVGTVQKDGLLNVEGVASRPVGKGVNSGRIENMRTVGSAIREAKAELENDLNIRINEAYAGISGDFVRCALYTDHVFIKDPSGCISKEDVASLHDRMRNVMADEGEQIMSRMPQNYVIDDSRMVDDDPVGTFGRKLSATFLFVLCQKIQIERVKMSFHNAGMTLLDIFVNPAVLPDAVLTDGERDEGVAVVDIGGGTTDVAVVRGGKLRYAASIPIGAASINADMRAFGIADCNTESIKKKYGSAVSELVDADRVIQIQMAGQQKRDFLQRNLAAIVEARLKDIAEFVWNEIRDAKFSTKIPCGLVLTGGSALLTDIDELFRRETGANVRLGGACRGINEESQQKIGTYAHSAAVAILVAGAAHGACDVVGRTAVPGRAEARDIAEPQRPQRPEMAAAPAAERTYEEPEREPAAEGADVSDNRSAGSDAEPERAETPDQEPKGGKEENKEGKKKKGLFESFIKTIDEILGNSDQEYL